MKATLLALSLMLGASAATAPAASPPLCRVTASYRPAWTGSVLPDSFRNVTVRLVPGCEGEAHIQTGNYGGRGGTAGAVYLLDAATPARTFTAPSYRTFWWLSQSNTPYLIPLIRR